MKNLQEQAESFAKELGRLLVQYLSTEEITEAIRLNHTPKYKEGKFDAAHDFLSVEDVLAEAFKNVFGVEFEASNVEWVEIVNKGHELAIQNNYYFFVTNENVVKVAECFLSLLPEITTCNQLTAYNDKNFDKVEESMQKAFEQVIGRPYNDESLQDGELSECAYVAALIKLPNTL